jgi:copper resistance protein C
MSKKVLFSTLIAACNFVAFAAAAHPELKATVPAANASTHSPTEIRLLFNEALLARYSGAELKDEAGKHIETGAAAVAGDGKKQLFVPLKPQLAPGKYTVEWHAVSEDTHRVKGSFTFKVEP